MGARSKQTPIRKALTRESELVPKVVDGISALKNADRTHIDEAVRNAFADSLDLDTALQEAHPQENRWDYLLGHSASGELVALEPHSAKEDEITTVIKKRKAAKQQLADHLEPSARVSKWLWVASGKVHFADTEKARRRLDQNGIEFIGSTVRAKHLPASMAAEKSGRR